MKRAVLWIGVVALIAFLAGIFAARFGSDVQQIKEARNKAAPRTVPENWPQVRLSPGHSQHIINEQVDCNECHDPADETFGAPDTGVCTACHEEQASLAHVDLDGAPMDCYTCHIFGSRPDVFGRWDCTRCHGSFQSEGLEGLAMHASVPCENCHNPHKPSEEIVRECDECHKKMNLQHGRSRLSGSCAGCHGGHNLASDAASCMECHGTQDPMVPESATFGDGHDSCANCHQPHAFSASTALRCTSCHKRKQVLAQKKVREHQDCTSCHEDHAVREANSRTCKGCHDDVVSTHPAQSGEDCISCHDPHPGRATQIARPCSQCHEEASSERAFHSKEIPCTACHEPHRFDLKKLSDRALCGRCHTLQTRLTRRNLGHASCRACHEGQLHELSGVAACKTCHEEQFSNSRARAGHIECLNCHEPHGGAVSPGTSCSGCHKVNQLPGLHRIPDQSQGAGHSQCTACHEMHQAEVHADRANCMTCHEDVANHQPEATRCTGCHTFISGR